MYFISEGAERISDYFNFGMYNKIHTSTRYVLFSGKYTYVSLIDTSVQYRNNFQYPILKKKIFLEV
jgi:hypothetical protein